MATSIDANLSLRKDGVGGATLVAAYDPGRRTFEVTFDSPAEGMSAAGLARYAIMERTALQDAHDDLLLETAAVGDQLQAMLSYVAHLCGWEYDPPEAFHSAKVAY